ncbi:MAG: 2-isopropylmalate synthase [Deltaproteobacteria bacterium]|nr:2-isopropylmalate synthase [Candidatus Anaeroferrophillus wilburensis]MBN2888076.1 2-isopropylmalate synthase [Deltaproteobacteria bacterium]
MSQVKIFDTTLRDGEQSPGASMNIEEKLMVARQLERLGVDIIEAGFPIASDGDFQAVKMISQEIRGCEVAGLARANRSDIARAWEALHYAAAPRIHTFIATSPIHMKFKLQKKADEVLADAVAAVTYAKTLTDNVEFSAEDATRSDIAFLCRIFTAVIEAGATTINIPDTVGYATPEEYGALIRTIAAQVPNSDRAVISVHCHNDLGLATANSLAAVVHGARQVECTVNGIGERAGNASLEELVMTFRTRHDLLHYETNIDTTQIYPTSRLVSQVTGIKVQPNKAIIGANAFAHEAGIHQDGVLKEKSTYEIMTPESIGLPQNRMVMGKHSGRHAFRDRIMGLGYELSDEQVEVAFKAFKKLSDKKKDVFDEDIDALIADEIIRIPHYCKLVYINVNSGSVSVPNATIQLEVGGETLEGAEFGDGPVDATFKAIKRLTGTNPKLLTYEIKSITGGTDALGEVTVRIDEGGLTVMGQGAHTDVIVASAKAYINALNKLEYKKHNRPQATV